MLQSLVTVTAEDPRTRHIHTSDSIARDLQAGDTVLRYLYNYTSIGSVVLRDSGYLSSQHWRLH